MDRRVWARRNAASSAAVVCLLSWTASIGTAAAQPPPNTLSDEERTAGFKLLFDGRTLSGWRGYNRPDRPLGWSVEDGALVRSGPGGDIITEAEFGDFELVLDWKVAPGGNSGVFYRAEEGYEQIWHAAAEMQILDDAAHPDGRNPLTRAGALYGLYPASAEIVAPGGEWNRSRIVAAGRRIEHWLNGVKIVEYEIGSEDWRRRVAASKFAAWPAFGRAARGHIGLQDHGDTVWYRNVKIRALER